MRKSLLTLVAILSSIGLGSLSFSATPRADELSVQATSATQRPGIRPQVKTKAKTGVEIEARTAKSPQAIEANHRKAAQTRTAELTYQGTRIILPHGEREQIHLRPFAAILSRLNRQPADRLASFRWAQDQGLILIEWVGTIEEDNAMEGGHRVRVRFMPRMAWARGGSVTVIGYHDEIYDFQGEGIRYVQGQASREGGLILID